MKSLNLLPWILASSVLLVDCAHKPPKPEEYFATLPQEVVLHVRQAVFEVVIPRKTSPNLDLEHPGEEESPKAKDDYISLGTAFRVGPKRFVSAAHVFDTSMPTLWTGRLLRDAAGGTAKPSRVIRFSRQRDLIEFEVDAVPATWTSLETASTFAVGDSVFAFGNTNGDGITYRSGQIGNLAPSAMHGDWKDILFYSPVWPGISGSPLLNAKGQVLGVVFAKDWGQGHNLAVPFSELAKAPTSEADLTMHELPLLTLPGPHRATLNAKIPLPKSFAQFESDALSAMVRGSQKMWDETLGGRKFFPSKEEFRAFARQSYVYSRMGVLRSDAQGAIWAVEGHDGKPQATPTDEEPLKLLWNYMQRPFDLGLLKRPEGKTLQSWLKDGKGLGTQMVFGGYASYLGRFLKVKKLGEPDATSQFKDHLGRTWFSSEWHHHDLNFMIANSCTPVPDGAACFLMFGQFDALKLDPVQRMVRAADRVLVSYSGSLQEWVDFLQLKTVPDLFAGAKFEKKGNRLTFSLGSFSGDLKSFHLAAKSELIAVPGYDPASPLGQTLQQVEFYPSSEGTTYFIAHKRYEPADKDDSSWKKILARSAPYNDWPTVYQGGDRQINAVLDSPKREPASKGIRFEAVVTCENHSSESEEALVEDCKRFKEGVKVR